jgi:hypothetical protein
MKLSSRFSHPAEAPTEAPFSFTIQRSQWLRGASHSYLYRPTDGKMCCLGFFGKACGLTYGSLSSRKTPASVSGKDPFGIQGKFLLELSYPLFPSSLGYNYHDTPAADTLMKVNDEYDANDNWREAEIIRLFALQGIQVTFVD